VIQAARHGPKASQTREAILAAAEDLFGERGFASARLEDVAQRVGIRRASLLYYFCDKAELYDAVLASLLGALHVRVAAVVRAGGGLAQRVERAVGEWIDFVGERPALARIILRETADAARERPAAILHHLPPFHALGRELFAASRDDPLVRAAPIDPVHFASAIGGATIFFVAAMPVLVPGSGLEPLEPAQLASHRAEVLRMARRLLGTSLRAGARDSSR